MANGGGMADNTDEAYEHFLLIQAGLEHHPRSEEYLALARQITAERDWGTRLYRFTAWLLQNEDDEQ